MQFETQCLHAGYQPKSGEPRVQPIVQSTTFTYDSAEDIGDLFDLKKAGFFYTRLANPTTKMPLKRNSRRCRRIVVHSTTKYLDGHAVAMGGVIIDGGNFNWNNGKFPAFTQPDDSYHGLIYTKTFGAAAYIVKARVQLMRDLGATPAPQNSFLLNLGMETLPLRMQAHYNNALQVAQYLENNL
ncbi:hypothetical protein SMUG_17790 [Gallibacterium anatis]